MSMLLKPLDQFTAEEKTAYHEAAHVVAYLAEGMPFEYVSIIPEDDKPGRVVGKEMPRWVREALDNWRITDWVRLWVENLIVVYLAGPVADEVLERTRNYVTEDEYQAVLKLAS